MSTISILRNVVLATVSVTLAAHAQISSVNSAPATVARVFFRSLQAKDWTRAVQFIHHDALESFRAEELKWARQALEVPPADDSTLSPAIRAHLDSIRSRMRAGWSPLLKHFRGIPTIDSLGRLPPSQFLARFWQSADLPSRALPDSSPLRATREVLGAVIVSDTLAYVLYRMTGYPNFPSRGPYILETRRSHKKWLLMLNEELKCIPGCWTEYVEDPDST